MTSTENESTHYKVMRGDNTVIYIIAAVILLHFVAGIGYLIYKLTKKK